MPIRDDDPRGKALRHAEHLCWLGDSVIRPIVSGAAGPGAMIPT